MDFDAAFDGLPTLTPDRLALARGQRTEEVIEGLVSRIVPVELLIRAMKKAAVSRNAIRLVKRSHGPTKPGDVAELNQTVGKGRLCTSRRRPRCDQQSTPARRRKRHRDLKLGIIAAARALVGFGPAVIKHVFPTRVRFQIARATPSTWPSSVSASRCCGCQPVLAETDFEISRQDRKAWDMKGLYSPWQALAEAAPKLAQESQLSAATSLSAEITRMRRLVLMISKVSGVPAPSYLI